MKAAVFFLLFVTVLTTLSLGSSTVPVGSSSIAADGKKCPDSIDKTPFIALPLESSTTPEDTVSKLERIVAKIKATTGEIKGAFSAAVNKIDCAIRRKKVNAVQALVTKAFDIAFAALVDAIKAVEEALAKAKGAEKKRLTRVLNGLKPFVDLGTSVINSINDALAKDTKESLQNTISFLWQAIVKIKANKRKNNRIFGVSPSKYLNIVKAFVEKKLDIIVAYSNDILKELETLLPGAGKGCNAAASDVKV